MNILVLAGGVSPERDVSLVSAAEIARALIKGGNKVAVVDLAYGVNEPQSIIFTDNIEDISEYKISEKSPETEQFKNKIGKNILACCGRADIVFLALHGDVGENGRLQAMLDLYNISYTGSGSEGCMLSMNKHLAKLIAESAGIVTPRWSVNEKSQSIAFPCVVKPSGCGSSIGVEIVNNASELENAIKSAAEYDDCVLVEEKISGREFSVGVINNKALPVIEIETKKGFYDYRNKYQPGRTIETCPANLRSDIAIAMQNTAVRIHNLLKLGYYSRVDFIVDGSGEIYFLEANSLPGMTPLSLLPQEARAAGIDFVQLCRQIAENPQNLK
ncbi:MAG: D-alanine--D-alanine ligase [Eubacterium sp.]